jgi:hypothetical protein
MKLQLQKRYAFFKENAGYVVGRRALGALALARAETLAEAQPERIEFRWEPDQAADRGPEDWGWPKHEVRRFWRTEHEVWGCALMVDGEHRSSLWGIWDPSEAYRREIQADLMLQTLSDNNPIGLPVTARSAL